MKTDKNELLSKVIDRYMFHAGELRQTTNPIICEILKAILDVEIDEFWMLTQI